MLVSKSAGSVEVISVDHDALVSALKKTAGKIKAQVNGVSQIVLFGSVARGEELPSSDIDILIIITKTNVPFLNRRDEFVDYFGDIPLNVNPLVYSEDELLALQQQENGFIKQALSEGIAL